MSGAGRVPLRGVIPAIFTPFDERGEIQFDALERQVSYLSEAGVHGFFIGGTTGEGAFLSTEEKKELFRRVRGVTQGRQFLCAAAICPSTRMVLAELNSLETLEPDFVVAVTPFYLSVTQADILQHFRDVTRRATAPLIVYNIPANTHNPIHLDTVLQLAKEKNVAGVKDSTGDFISFSRGVLQGGPKDFSWIQGEDYLDGPALMVGASGLVTGLGNARIEPYVALYRAAERQDWAAVRACQGRINRLYGISHLCGGRTIAALKAAAALSGRGSRWLRIPTMSLSDAEMRAVERYLKEFDENP